MKKIFLFVLPLLGMLLNSCGSLKQYSAEYKIGLHSVESPEDVKKQFGDTKIVDISENGGSKYQYEDDFIKIKWWVSAYEFNFELTNKTKHALKINWDDISYVDIRGNAGRVMHKGIKYIDRNESQAPTTVPRGATISDILIPTENVYFLKGAYGGWRTKTLFPFLYNSKAELNAAAGAYIGQKMTILMPIKIEDTTNEYNFVFNVDEWVNAPAK